MSDIEKLITREWLVNQLEFANKWASHLQKQLDEAKAEIADLKFRLKGCTSLLQTESAERTKSETDLARLTAQLTPKAKE
jgi:hypothetical protein